jgi:WD40 repeat protein
MTGARNLGVVCRVSLLLGEGGRWFPFGPLLIMFAVRSACVPASLGCLVFAGLSTATPLRAATVDFARAVMPVLKDNCIPCHNKTTTKGGLNMETVEAMIAGGDSGAGLIAGEGGDSLIYQAAAGDWDSEMPPKNNKVSAVPLTSGQLALLKQWIDEGAHHSGMAETVIDWRPLPAGFAPVLAVAASGDGQFTAAGRGNQVAVYHLPTNTMIASLVDPALRKEGTAAPHRDVVSSLAFSPDGQRLATGGFREIKIWRRQAVSTTEAAAAKPHGLEARLAGEAVEVVKADGTPVGGASHGAVVRARALSGSGSLLATAGEDAKIKIWRLPAGELMSEIAGDFDSVSALESASLAADRAALEVAALTEAVQKAGKESADLEARLKKGNELAATAEKTLADKQKEVSEKEAALSKVEAALKALEQAEIGDQTPQQKEEAEKKSAAAREAADTARAAAEQARGALTRAKAGVADAKDEIEQVTRWLGEAGVKSEQTTTALENAKKELEQAGAARDKRKAAFDSALRAVGALVFSPDERSLAGLAADGKVSVWAVSSGRVIGGGRVELDLAWDGGAGPAVVSRQALPDPAQVTWRLERTLGSGDAKSPITDRVNALAFSPDGSALAAGSGEPSRTGDITLWRMRDGALAGEWSEVHLDTVLALQFSPDGGLLASGGADKVLRVLDAGTGEARKVFEGHTHHVLGVAWRADGRLLASAGADAVVKVWDWETGERRQNIAGWDKEVTAIRYAGATDLIATGSGDGRVRLVTSAGAETKVFAGEGDFINALAMDRAGAMLVAGGQDGSVRVWDAGTAKEVAEYPGSR